MTRKEVSWTILQPTVPVMLVSSYALLLNIIPFVLLQEQIGCCNDKDKLNGQWLLWCLPRTTRKEVSLTILQAPDAGMLRSSYATAV